MCTKYKNQTDLKTIFLFMRWFVEIIWKKIQTQLWNLRFRFEKFNLIDKKLLEIIFRLFSKLFVCNKENKQKKQTQSKQTMSSSESTEAAGPNEQRGYCHVCDSQVQIEPVSFTCSVCNGGFIELLDTTETTQQGQHTMNSENFSRFMNDGVS